MILQRLKMRDKGKGECELIVEKKKLDPIEMAMAMARKSLTGEKEVTKEEGEDQSKIQNQFVDVGTFSCGGVFAIGEEMENRIIIARNTVQCLLIPRHWLFQKAQNIGNVFQRIKLFLNSSVPSQQRLFEEYLANRKWKKYKKKTIEEVRRLYCLPEPTTQYYNIPIICRIEEGDL